MNIKIKFTLVLIAATFVSLVIVSSIVTMNVSKEMYEQVFTQLDSIRASKQNHIEDYFDTIHKQVVTYSENDMIVEAMDQFKFAFHHLDVKNPSDETSLNKYQRSLGNYYSQGFGAEFEKKNGEATHTDALLPSETNSLIAQYLYIGDNQNPLGSKHELDAASDSSMYSQLHAKYHPIIRHYLEEFEYYDIFLVDPDTGHIVYSVFKELDYATSLITGPYSNTNFAESFKQAANSRDPKSVHLVDFKPYLPSYNAAASFISSPIFKGEELIGVLVFQMPVGQINAIMNDHTGMGETGEAYLVGEDKRMRSQSRFTEENTIISRLINTASVDAVLSGKTAVDTVKNAEGDAILSAFAPMNLDGLKWGIMVEMHEDEAMQAVGSVMFSIIIITVVAILILIPIAFWYAGTLTKPIVEIIETTVKMAEGDFTQKLTPKGRDEVAWLTHTVKQMQTKVVEVISNVHSSTQHLAEAADEISATSQSLSQSSSEQASSVEETSASIEQMSAGISQNNENATLTDNIASETATDATTGGEAVNQTVQAMGQIADKISIIEDIAYQTNILALNASIEAARAGAHGRGFSVVATEVRKLAERSQAAASEISDLTTNSVGVAKNAGTLLDQIVPNIQKTADLVQEISAASDEQASGAIQITNAMGQLDSVTQQNAAASEELAATADEMKGQVESLTAQLSFFKIGDEGQYAPVEQVKTESTPLSTVKNTAKKVGDSLSNISDPEMEHFERF